VFVHIFISGAFGQTLSHCRDTVLDGLGDGETGKRRSRESYNRGWGGKGGDVTEMFPLKELFNRNRGRGVRSHAERPPQPPNPEPPKPPEPPPPSPPKPPGVRASR
jgi:hypothetical protein